MFKYTALIEPNDSRDMSEILRVAGVHQYRAYRCGNGTAYEFNASSNQALQIGKQIHLTPMKKIPSVKVSN